MFFLHGCHFLFTVRSCSGWVSENMPQWKPLCYLPRYAMIMMMVLNSFDYSLPLFLPTHTQTVPVLVMAGLCCLASCSFVIFFHTQYRRLNAEADAAENHSTQTETQGLMNNRTDA